MAKRVKQMSEHSKRKHSSFAASSAARWLTCPGSVKLSETAPPQPESKYAKEGTDAHECLEFIVKRYSNLLQAAEQAKEKWPDEMVLHAMNSARDIWSLKPSPSAKLLIETRVVLKSIGKELFGTLDYAWVDPWGTLIVIDYKYGAGHPVLPVSEEGEPNPQLMYYALGIALKYDFEFSQVKLAVIQPRVWREGESPLTEGIVTIKQLRDFEAKVKEAVKAAKQPQAKLIPSEDACRWCPAAPLCPELSKVALKSAEIAFDLESTNHDIEELPSPLVLDESTMPRILNACDRLETWIEKVRAHALLMAMEGKKIEGRKLVEKRSIRKWIPEAQTHAHEKYGDEIWIEPEMLSPAQFEKKFGKEAKDFTEKFTSSASSGVTLVKASDKRPEVENISAFSLDFEE